MITIDEQILRCIDRERLGRLLHDKARVDGIRVPRRRRSGTIDAVGAEVAVTADPWETRQLDTGGPCAVEVQRETFADAAVGELALDDGSDTHDGAGDTCVCGCVRAHRAAGYRFKSELGGSCATSVVPSFWER